MKKLLYLGIGTLLLFTACRSIGEGDKITSINIIDRNGMSETISSQDRLDAYQQTDFLGPQPYQKVLRFYARDKKGDVRSQITSYHPNGQIKQHLEAVNNRANGNYREWYSNGQLKLEATVIGGSADINTQAEESWLFEGNNRAWDEEGHLIAEFHYVKGELQGESIYYHSNGKIWKKNPYQNNFLNGTYQVFLETGSLLQTIEYQNGVKQGQSIRYWNNKQTAAEESYDKGLLIQARYFDSQGSLISEIKEGSGFKALFGKEKLQELQEYRKGVQEGLVKIFNEEHQLIRTFSILNSERNGEEIDYYPQNMQPKLLITWNNGVIQGPVKTWYENGTLETMREMSQNNKNGLLTAWYKNGSLMLVEEYDNDKLVKGEYYRLNEKIPVSKIEHGQGIAMMHNSDGYFIKKIAYRDGIPEANAS